MRLTRKNQVTIPKAVRDTLRIGPGSEVGFENRDGNVVLTRLDTDPPIELDRPGEMRGDRFVRILREFGKREERAGRTSGLTTDEIMDMTRGPFDDLDPH